MLAPRTDAHLRSVQPCHREPLLRALQLSETSKILDIGCGDGRVLIWAAQHVPGCSALGYEIDEERANQAQGLVRDAGLDSQVTIKCGNALEAPLEGVTHAFLFLTTRGMRKVLPMLQDAKTRVRVISMWFKFDNVAPVETLKLDDERGMRHPLYVYEIGGEGGGVSV